MEEVEDFNLDINYPPGIEEDTAVAYASAVVAAAEVAGVEHATTEAVEPETAKAIDLACGPIQIAKTPKANNKQCRKGVHNYSSAEVVATVWAYIAMSEEEVVLCMASQLRRIATMYRLKAQELRSQGKWPENNRLSPDQSADLRCGNPQSIYNHAKKAIEVVVNTVSPVWQLVKKEHHNGWGLSEFVQETKRR